MPCLGRCLSRFSAYGSLVYLFFCLGEDPMQLSEVLSAAVISTYAGFLAALLHASPAKQEQ